MKVNPIKESLSLSANSGTCGGILKAMNGSFTSPNFPQEYPPNKRCVWEVVGPKNHQIFLNFTQFSLEGMKYACAYDFVLVEKVMGTKVQDVKLNFSPLLEDWSERIISFVPVFK